VAFDLRLQASNRADRYWRAACALTAAHIFGISWPPPGQILRKRIVGHWGANPGLAWIAAGAGDPNAGIVAVGDVCVTESIAATALAAERGVAISVIAVIDVTAFDPEREAATLPIAPAPLIGLSWCAPRLIEGLLFHAAGRPFPVIGPLERYGATAWETLQANEMDRHSILERLALPAHRAHPQVLLCVGRQNSVSE